jgi:hypothetical protein
MDGRGAAVWVGIDSQWAQVPSDIHKSTFFRPEEAAPWLGQCKNTDHKAAVFRKHLLAFAFSELPFKAFYGLKLP